MKKLMEILGSVAFIGALSGTVDSANAGDYVKESKWGLLGAGHTVTYTHTELGIVYVPQKVLYRDNCDNCVEGISWTPRCVEVITEKCRTSHVDWNKSILSIPGRTLSGIGNALTPKPRAYCPPVRCAPVCAPVRRTPVVVQPNYNPCNPDPCNNVVYQGPMVQIQRQQQSTLVPQQMQPIPAPPVPKPIQGPEF